MISRIPFRRAFNVNVHTKFHRRSMATVPKPHILPSGNGSHRPLIGLALGSGTAKGWAHIGVINALMKHDIYPDVVAGASIGALVGAAYASEKMPVVEEYARSITWRDYISMFDFSLFKRNVSGIVYGEKIMQRISREVNTKVEDMKYPFIAVATDLRTGKEIWLQKGDLVKALRASIAMPGFLTPVKDEERSTPTRTEWLVDGGLVNPLPVSACRALGAEIVIAVNLQKNLVVKNFPEQTSTNELEHFVSSKIFSSFPGITDTASSMWEYVTKSVEGITPSLELRKKAEKEDPHLMKAMDEAKKSPTLHPPEDSPPHILKVVMASLNIMQHRIVTSRLATDPPEIEIAPDLTMEAFDFHKAPLAIRKGEESVEQALPAIREILQLKGRL